MPTLAQTPVRVNTPGLGEDVSVVADVTLASRGGRSRRARGTAGAHVQGRGWCRAGAGGARAGQPARIEGGSDAERVLAGAAHHANSASGQPLHIETINGGRSSVADTLDAKAVFSYRSGSSSRDHCFVTFYTF